MKIGLICPYNLFKSGGVQECVLALEAGLAKRGHDVLVVTPQPRDHSAAVPSFVRLLGTGTEVKSPFHTTHQVSGGVDGDEVETLLATEKFDVLHFHEPWVPLMSKQILQRSKAKNIATFHAKLPDTLMSRTIEKVITPYTRSVLKYLDVLTAVSEPATIYVRSLTHTPVSIVPNGIDLKTYQVVKRTKQTDSPYVLFIGRLEGRKGVKYLLQAMALLQTTHPHVTLKVVGDGPDRLQLERYAKELKVKVEFLGRVDTTTKLHLLQNAALFSSLARYGESFGIVLLEAMACGVPIVAGDNPGYATVLKGTGGLSLVDPRQTSDVVRHMTLLLDDQDVRKLWQQWAQKSILQYDYEQIVSDYEAIYQQMVL